MKKSNLRVVHDTAKSDHAAVDHGIDVRTMHVGRQALRVAIKDGPEGVPPLLLFNGIGANWELAKPLIGALTGRGAIIFDVPGIGGSPLPRMPYRPSGIAKLAAGIVRQLGYEQVDAAGVSWGGGPAQEFALNHPDLCRRLVLAATSPGVIMVPGNPRVMLKLATPRRYLDKHYLAAIAGEIYGGAFRTDSALIKEHAKGMAGMRSLGYVFQLLALAGWTNLPWLWSIKQPTLVLMGADDPLVPTVNGRILAGMIPRGRFELIDDGHLFMVTKPVETASRIEAFLS